MSEESWTEAQTQQVCVLQTDLDMKSAPRQRRQRHLSGHVNVKKRFLNYTRNCALHLF